MRIIFMGTPDFAVASLEALLHAGEEVVAVITTPDKPAGRGQKMHESAVKKYAIQQGLPVLQPEKLRDPNFIATLRSYRADLQIVVAFRMLPEIVWNMPPRGTINVHASLLPQYRGAAPINHAIIQGETVTGVTTFLLQQEIDTGNILFSQQVEIAPDDTAGILHDKLMVAGAEILLKTVQAIKDDKLQPIPQAAFENTALKSAPKIFKEDGEIIWDNPTDQVYNQIRGLSPYPAAFTHLNGKVLKIFETTRGEFSDKKPGTYTTDGKNFLSFATQDGSLLVTSLQLEGKKRMAITDFLRGYRLD
ncbi:methionyl-tRNA formyltransferase [Sphingobacterium sp. FBM7-1]|uniref:methionyl-tRNA formyltransferase n=1 Tax=Sphingobacterium sp. FBM7-1 TaxID=2886688 RepID=UPI001D11A8B4|nr:methionyl-tRNA formyltransferase [Sphingobacterium sp. FBM7-1]MCC2598492.1 methionyl-tRNA formyltransferase [Sphingobacterium sp. FBM7-1]